MSTVTTLPAGTAIRPLRLEDLERIIAIDATHTGAPRRRFMERRLRAAHQAPDEYLQVGVEHAGTLIGFALGRILQGEFGWHEPVMVLDVIGVELVSREHGYGHMLMDAVVAVMRARGVRRLHSQADWRSHNLLQFLDSTGFRYAPRIVLQRSTSLSLAERGEEV